MQTSTTRWLLLLRNKFFHLSLVGVMVTPSSSSTSRCYLKIYSNLREHKFQCMRHESRFFRLESIFFQVCWVWGGWKVGTQWPLEAPTAKWHEIYMPTQNAVGVAKKSFFHSTSSWFCRPKRAESRRPDMELLQCNFNFHSQSKEEWEKTRTYRAYFICTNSHDAGYFEQSQQRVASSKAHKQRWSVQDRNSIKSQLFEKNVLFSNYFHAPFNSSRFYFIQWVISWCSNLLTALEWGWRRDKVWNGGM